MTTTPAVPPALLAFSLGPVQDFIATARRTQDLWMGSYILSFLTQAALRAVVGDVQDSAARERIIYPDISGEGKAQHPILRAFWMDEKAPQGVALATLPNKFVAWAEDSGAAAQLGRSAEAAVYAAWETLSQSVARHFPGRLAASNWQGLSWGANPREWFEVYWAVETPLAGDDYARLSGRAEAALQARKRLRNFLPVEAEGEKCTLCGVRPSLAPRPNLPRSVLKEAWRQLALDLHKYSDRNDPEYDSNYGGLTAALTADGSERLCAVCAAKRFAQRYYFDSQIGLRGSFPSTSSVATVAFRQAVLDREAHLRKTAGHDAQDTARRLAKARADILTALRASRVPVTLAENAFPGLTIPAEIQVELDWQRYDGDLFYPDTYTLKRLETDYGIKVSEAQLRNLQSKVRVLRAAAARAGAALPGKYYAVLAVDGDGLGKRLGRAQAATEHLELSRALRQFALTQVPPIIEDQHRGRIVYAGGDDVLAFLPLEHALSAADAIRAAFGASQLELTLSAGLVVAHHQAPLDGVLHAVRQAEETAKRKYGRDAVVITVLKRSGEQLDVAARWGYAGLQEAGAPVGVLRLVERLRIAIQSGELSGKLAFDVQREAGAVRDFPNADYQKLLGRLLGRHVSPAAASGSLLADMAAQLGALRAGLTEHWRFLERAEIARPIDRPAPTEMVARWLLLARFLAGAGEE